MKEREAMTEQEAKEDEVIFAVYVSAEDLRKMLETGEPVRYKLALNDIVESHIGDMTDLVYDEVMQAMANIHDKYSKMSAGQRYCARINEAITIDRYEIDETGSDGND